MSDGLRLSGLLRVPAETGAGPRPGIIMLHGFGGTKDAPTHRHEAEAYAELGYVVLQVDFRGCGASEGARGRILCQDAVADAKNALTWFAAQPEVDPQRIAMTGQSYGAANDSVTPTTGSMELMRRAGPGAELMLLGGMDHFAFAGEGSRLRSLLVGWLDAYFPLTAAAR